MLRLTARCQNVTVMTLSSLRGYLETVSNPGRRFSISSVHRDRVSVRCDYMAAGKKQQSGVLLPAYPTGSPDDAPCNNLNVVLDPVQFEGAESCSEREVFAPLFNDDILAQYEKTHPIATLPVSRCC